MSTPLSFDELVTAIRELYRDTPREFAWFVGVRQYAMVARPTWELWTGREELVTDSPQRLLSLARLAYGFEPDEGDAS